MDSTTPTRIITIDGPSGSGKGTIARRTADRLGWRLLDSGALYRLVGYEGKRRGISADNEPTSANGNNTDSSSVTVQCPDIGITKVADAYVSLEVAPNVEINVQRGAVQMLLPKIRRQARRVAKLSA